jgi:NIPSNAP
MADLPPVPGLGYVPTPDTDPIYLYTDELALEHHSMITCYLRYQVDPDKLSEFEAYGAMWLDLMPRFGGIHHGYFLPSEGESDVALAMFSFPSLSAYEQYRKDAGADPDVAKAVAFARQTRCFIRYERSFFRPLLPKAA